MPVLKLDKDDQEKEIEFEKKYLRSLTVAERFRMMFKKSKEMRGLLKNNGYRKSAEVIKRT